jgi:hypothetical protein
MLSEEPSTAILRAQMSTTTHCLGVSNEARGVWNEQQRECFCILSGMLVSRVLHQPVQYKRSFGARTPIFFMHLARKLRHKYLERFNLAIAQNPSMD